MSEIPVVSIRKDVYLTRVLPDSLLANPSEERVSRALDVVLYPQLERLSEGPVVMESHTPLILSAGEKFEPEVSNTEWTVCVLLEKAKRGGDLYLPKLRFSSREIPAGWGILIKGEQSVGFSRVREGESFSFLMSFNYQRTNVGVIDPQDNRERLALAS